MKNEQLRLYLRGNGVTMWELADRLGVSEPTLTRLFRRDLPPEKEREIKQIIADIKVERKAGSKDVHATHTSQTSK
ncbi:MAG: hypothetical protein IJK28_10555 [Clostridia bacterium]|nr:hypothetical protein [Clostridia bacterium]